MNLTTSVSKKVSKIVCHMNSINVFGPAFSTPAVGPAFSGPPLSGPQFLAHPYWGSLQRWTFDCEILPTLLLSLVYLSFSTQLECMQF